jgi:hypothetical protein
LITITMAAASAICICRNVISTLAIISTAPPNNEPPPRVEVERPLLGMVFAADFHLVASIGQKRWFGFGKEGWKVWYHTIIILLSKWVFDE